jgi:hypothetical protein
MSASPFRSTEAANPFSAKSTPTVTLAQFWLGEHPGPTPRAAAVRPKAGVALRRIDFGRSVPNKIRPLRALFLTLSETQIMAPDNVW